VCENEDHGLKVPTGTIFAYVPKGDNVAHAFIQWRKPGDEMFDRVWAPNEATLAELPRAGQPALGLRVQELCDKGRLVSATGMLEVIEDFVRVDDWRKGRGWTYQIWLSPKELSGIMPLAGTVYHFYPDEDTHVHPRVEEFGAVQALWSDPNALVVTDIGDIEAGTSFDDPVVKAKWDLDNRVVVWDLGAIQRAGSNA